MPRLQGSLLFDCVRCLRWRARGMCLKYVLTVCECVIYACVCACVCLCVCICVCTCVCVTCVCAHACARLRVRYAAHTTHACAHMLCAQLGQRRRG